MVVKVYLWGGVIEGVCKLINTGGGSESNRHAALACNYKTLTLVFFRCAVPLPTTPPPSSLSNHPQGSQLVIADVDMEAGTLTLNKDFVVSREDPWWLAGVLSGRHACTC